MGILAVQTKAGINAARPADKTPITRRNVLLEEAYSKVSRQKTDQIVCYLSDTFKVVEKIFALKMSKGEKLDEQIVRLNTEMAGLLKNKEPETLAQRIHAFAAKVEEYSKTLENGTEKEKLSNFVFRLKHYSTILSGREEPVGQVDLIKILFECAKNNTEFIGKRIEVSDLGFSKEFSQKKLEVFAKECELRNAIDLILNIGQNSKKARDILSTVFVSNREKGITKITLICGRIPKTALTEIETDELRAAVNEFGRFDLQKDDNWTIIQVTVFQNLKN